MLFGGMLPKFDHTGIWCAKSSFSGILSHRASNRKLYWTDGDNISMANTDGTNRSILFTNQKGPVGETLGLCFCRTADETALPSDRANVYTFIFAFKASPSTLMLSSFTGSAQEAALSATVTWTAQGWKCLKGPRASWSRLPLWPSWVGLQSIFISNREPMTLQIWTGQGATTRHFIGPSQMS